MPTINPLILSVTHINDTHSHFEPSPITLSLPDSHMQIKTTTGGFARIKNVVEHFRQQAKEKQQGFLFLHAGDCFQGSLYYSLFKGDINARLLNMLGLDAMTLGNHELDLGNGPVSDFLSDIHFPLLAGNWDVSHELPNKTKRLSDKPQLRPYLAKQKRADVVIKEFNGHQVAIFGVSIDKMSAIANPDPDTPFVSSLEVVKNTVKRLHDQGIKNIILLSHLGYAADLDMAEQVDGLSVIIGGHSHTLQGDFSALGLGFEEPYGRCESGTLVLQACCHAMFLGAVELEFNSHGEVTHHSGNNFLLLDEDCCQNASLTDGNSDIDDVDAKREAICALKQQDNVLFTKTENDIHDVIGRDYKPAVHRLESDIVTFVPHLLRHIRVPDQKGGSEIAPLVCEAMLFSARCRGIPADFAIHNAGGVRVSVSSGSLTAAEIAGRLLPFEIDIVEYRVSGKQVRLALEGAIDNAINNGINGTGDGSFPYTAYLRFDYDKDLPIGRRISSLQYRVENEWRSVEDNGLYRSVSSAYTTKGKEGYDALEHPGNNVRSVGVTLSESFIEYARTIESLEPVKPDMAGFQRF
ncbi:bifunctional metallophosphatase/5'-nucleotidase [Veronia pacifica]|uniref:Bifunctional metallophosphatase/5'-nucleotidase n=1 Tax=Veronia pacifica TaxID=1080227 RepID=A0A1C3EKJ4_9GAMM|nr:bifunctional metallophosphatase/5'-nucleotidase [Veronia pacifica]ODA33762.1 bifunctional metallophosphatase/5'-nucleotidase [Veronia pacifica]